MSTTNSACSTNDRKYKYKREQRRGRNERRTTKEGDGVKENRDHQCYDTSARCTFSSAMIGTTFSQMCATFGRRENRREKKKKTADILAFTTSPAYIEVIHQFSHHDIKQKSRLAQKCHSQAMAHKTTSFHLPCSKIPYFPTTFAQCSTRSCHSSGTEG